MWVFFAGAGFFSVVQAVGSVEDLVVRARVREDLVRLRRLYVPGLGRIETTPTRDYGVRARVAKPEFAAGLAKAVMAIDYGNFKNEVARQLGPSRAGVYGRIWSILLELQTPSRSLAAGGEGVR